MQVRKFASLVFFIFLAACTQIRAMNLPEGIRLLKRIDPSGLQSPIWSPNGKRIAAAYAIDSMPNLITFFGPESSHDVVIIDTETWELSVLVSGDGGYIAAGTWLPDSKGFTMLWPGGPEGTGIYLFEVDSPTPTYFSEWGIMTRVTSEADLSLVLFYGRVTGPSYSTSREVPMSKTQTIQHDSSVWSSSKC